jgi:hypothetical protein
MRDAGHGPETVEIHVLESETDSELIFHLQQQTRELQ